MKIGGLENVPICPVTFLKRYLALRPSGGGKLLLHESGREVTQFQFRTVLCRCLRLCGLQDKALSTHSFRIGAATDALQGGLGSKTIKRLGRRDLKCFQRYIRPNLLLV